MKWMNIVWILRHIWLLIIKLNVMQNILSHVIVGFFFFFCSMLMVLTNIYVYISAFVFIFDHFAAVLMVFYCINSKCIYFTSKHFFSFPFIPCDKHQSCSYHTRILGLTLMLPLDKFMKILLLSNCYY